MTGNEGEYVQIGGPDSGWDGDVGIAKHGDRSYFIPMLPKAARRLSPEGRDAVISLQDAVRDVQAAQDRLQKRATAARREGVSWMIVGWCLGLSGEAARKRWSELEDGTTRRRAGPGPGPQRRRRPRTF
jgi:hypothetical protein